MSMMVLRVIGPPIAQGLIEAFGVKSKLAKAIAPKNLATVARDLLNPTAQGADASTQVTTIVQQMAADLRPLFEGHDRQVGSHSREAIVFGLAQTLTKAGLTPAGLAEMNFDADTLERELLQANPGVDRDFSAAEQATYQRAIQLVSQRLIEVAPQVAGYEQAKATVTLQRLEAIAAQLDIERVLALQAEDVFVARYRQVVKDGLDRLEVFGLPRMDRLTSQQSLSMAYITLSASGIAKDTDEAEGIRALPLDGDKGDWRRPPEPRRILSQVDEAICDCRKLVIRGGAGAGKSTLMQWLAVRAASQSFEGKLLAWNTQIPFFIRLRRLMDTGFPAPERFPALIARNITAQMPDNWVHKYLERGQALVLIDGVDELPRRSRGDFLTALQDLVRDFPQATYIVTSRPSGLKDAQGERWQAWEDWVTAQGFQTLTLEPMTPPKVEEFVTQWHQALPSNPPQDLPLAAAPPEQTAQKLVRQLRQRPELQRLASTPLLCAMICALHRERLETLPSARLELYRECIDMLLNRRDLGRRIPLDESYPVGLNESQKIELLQSLALKLMRANLSSLDTDRVDRHFDQELKKTSLPEAVTGDQIRALFVERAALLREPVVGQIDFAHRTFQEYLAAKAVLAEDSLEELLQKATDDQWREAIIAAAGLARPAERASLLCWLTDRDNSKLSSRNDTSDVRDAKDHKYLRLLAVACLETTVTVDPKIRNHVLNCAKALMPPQDEDEVAMVVRAGSEAVPLLRYKPQYGGGAAARCIQALVTLGTDTALAALADYAQNASTLDPRVAAALGKGWDVFNRQPYLAQVLSQLSDLNLSQTQVSDLSPLRELTQLSELSLSQTQVSDLSPLRELTQLTYLDLSQTQVSDLSLLSELTQLSHLSLYRTQVSDLSPLRELTQLSILDLSGMKVSDLSPLRELTQLTYLDLSGTQVSDLSLLGGLAQLSDLNLSETQVSDLSPLRELTQLNILDLSQTQVSDLSLLPELTQLSHLSLSGTQVSDLSPLRELTQLSILDLSQTQVSDLSLLRELKQLRVLDLSQTQVSDLSLLRELKQLTYLDLSGTQASDLSPLRELKQLRYPRVR
jgi:Leucine-rich repeat (LRR) protein